MDRDLLVCFKRRIRSVTRVASETPETTGRDPNQVLIVLGKAMCAFSGPFDAVYSAAVEWATDLHATAMTPDPRVGGLRGDMRGHVRSTP